MAQLLLINPKARNMAKKHRTAAQKRATARMIAANRSRRGGAKRRSNPIAAKRRTRRSVARRANPVALYSRKMRRGSRRRRNPISLRSLGGGGSYMAMFKDAAIGGAGAVAFDLIHGQIAGFLPASMRRTPGTIGAGDAVKALLTAFLGQMGNKMTRGLSGKMARGSLTVQARDMIATLVPATMPLGYYTAAPVTNGTMRVGPNRRTLMTGQPSTAVRGPLLNRYVSGPPPLLNGRDAQMREGVSAYR